MSVLNVSHVKVWGRLVSGSAANKPSEIIISPDGSLVLSTSSESGKSHRLDRLNWTQDDLISQARKVLEGHNVCLLNLSIGENGNPGEFAKKYRSLLQPLFTGGKNSATIFFSILGINDISCIDLTDFSKVEDTNLNKTFRPAASLSDVLSAIPNEITLPTFLLVNLQRQTPEGITNGTLLLGDIGGTCLSTTSPAALDRSLGRINSVLLEMDQPFADSQVDLTDNWLSLLLKDFINGNGELVVCADLVQNGSIKALISGLLLLENLRKVKNFPHVNYVDENIRRLADLETMNDTLEQDKRQAQRDLRDLQKSLENLDEERRKLQTELDLVRCSSEVERFEKEYLAATLELQSLDLKDKLRKCEIDLISLDELNLRLKLEKHYLMAERAEQEQARKQREAEQNAHDTLQRRQIEELGSKLAHASLSIDTSRQEADQLRREISQANTQISFLNESLQKATQEHSQFLQKTANSPTKTLQEREIQSLRRQLESTKQTEERLTEMLKRNEDRAEDHRRLMMDLERQLGDLRAENARLAALNSVTKTPIIVQQPPPAPAANDTTEFRQLKQQTQELQSVIKELHDSLGKRKTEAAPAITEKKPRVYVKRPAALENYIPSPVMEAEAEPQTVADVLPKVMAALPPQVKQVASQIKATMPEAPPKPAPKKAPIKRVKTAAQEEEATPAVTFNSFLTKKEVLQLKKEKLPKKATESMINLQQQPPDSPSKYRPSTYQPGFSLKAVAINNENNPSGAGVIQKLFKTDSGKSKLKIPEKPTQVSMPTGGFRSKANIGGADIDSTALNNIISNMTVTMPPK